MAAADSNYEEGGDHELPPSHRRVHGARWTASDYYASHVWSLCASFLVSSSALHLVRPAHPIRRPPPLHPRA